MLAAGDTFRAAAIEQLKIWGERTGAPGRGARARLRCRRASPSTPSTEAKESGADVLLIDTAGRLQNKDRADGRARKDRPRARQARSGGAAHGAARRSMPRPARTR